MTVRIGNRFRYAAALGTALLGPLPGAEQALAEQVAWQADRPLTWSDFRAAVDPDAPPRNVALTAAALGWRYEIETSIGGGACSFRLRQIHSSAVFDTERSWVRPGGATPAVLAHEQAHFDIAQIHKLMFDAATADLIDTPRRCEGRTTGRASRFIEDEVERLIRDPYERIWQAHVSVQAAYDAETGHGTDPDAQQRWLELVAAALDGRRWTELERLAGR